MAMRALHIDPATEKVGDQIDRFLTTNPTFRFLTLIPSIGTTGTLAFVAIFAEKGDPIIEKGYTYTIASLPDGAIQATVASAGARRVGSGTTAVADTTTVTAGTLTRLPGEVMAIFSFVSEDAAGTGWGVTDEASVALGDVGIFLERTAIRDEFAVRIRNRSGASVTVEWIVEARTP